jgi:Lrp/AsnC family transcriptional regulator for asnA, asnC and gidA
MAKIPKFDPIDEQVVALLRTNGRRTNSELARHLGVTEGAVRKKLKKLSAAGVLQVVAVADPQKLGYVIDVFCAVQVAPGQTVAAAESLAALDAVRYAALATGPYDIVLEAMFRTQDEVLDFLTKTLPAIPGITRYETWHVLKVIKRNYDWLTVRKAE